MGVCDQRQGWDIVMADVDQKLGYRGAELEACLFAMKKALDHGFRRIVMEGGCFTPISKLQRKESPNNMLGFFISDIFRLSALFEFVSWSFVRRGGNDVAHAMAKYQPVVCGERIWREGVLDEILDLASRDMCIFLENRLI